MVGRKEALKAEMKELRELIDLYITSNPNYHRKGQEEKKSEEVQAPQKSINVAEEIENAFKNFSSVLLLN